MALLGFLLFSSGPKPEHNAPEAVKQLEVALRGVPNRGEPFEAIVQRVLGRFPDSFDGRGKAEPNEMIYPTSWPEATVVTVSQSDITFLVVSQGNAAKVHLLRDVEDSFPTFRATQAARIGPDLIVFGRIDGADYSAPAARCYHHSHGAWHETKALTAWSEEAWPGHGEKVVPEFQINPKKPKGIRFVLKLRSSPRHFWQCHLCLWLRYEEQWLFANGRLRRVSRRRISTPLAELDHLAGLVNRGDRGAFNARIPKKLRRLVWGNLGSVIGDDAFLDPIAESPDSDENSDLCPKFKGRGWIVRLAKRGSGWRIANAVKT